MSDDYSRGWIAALAAYAFWGLAPMYFKLLGGFAAAEIIAHRILWSVLVLVGVIAIRRRSALLAHLMVGRRTLGMLLVSGSLIGINWLIFVYAINTDRVLSTSLGYFINPIMSVILGLAMFRERLDRWQALAVLLAAGGTVYLTVMSGEVPWIALGLALSFAMYSVVRKVLDVGPMVGLFWETLLVSPLALLWLVFLARADRLGFGASISGDLLLAATGLVTVIPLVLFAFAARRLPLSTLGFLQYLAPSMTFCLAVFLFREPFTLNHAVAFAAIWLALIIFSINGWQRARRLRPSARLA